MILPILRLVLIYFLLVAGVVAVFNRDKLAPLFGGGGDEVAAVEPAAEAGEVGEHAQIGTPAADAVADGAPATEPAPEATATPDPAVPQELIFPAPDAATPDAATPDAAAPDAAAPDVAAAAPTEAAKPGNPGAPVTLGTPVATAPASPETVPTPEAAPVEPAPEPAPEAPAAAAELTAPVADTPDVASAAAPASLAEEIAAARAAYWAGDIEGARNRMMALSEANPEDPDVAGELGNLAFALRDYPAAAEAWHRAGLILIERGESGRVMSFLPFLQSIAPDKAAELAGQLQER